MSMSAAQCRILVISSTTNTAHQFVERVKTLSSDTRKESNVSDQHLITSTSSRSELGNLHAELTNSEPAVNIPWTISNRYYTADVHFELRPLDGFAGYLASEVPAVVYVWNHGETYKTAISELARKLEHYDPEVSLAVKFNPASSSFSDLAEEVSLAQVHDDNHKDELSLDEFISSHGFEYIAGDRGLRRPTQDGSGFSDEEDGGVPGLPRVVDALSTIMWPSLVQSTRATSRKSRAGDLLDLATVEDAGGGDAPLLRELAASQTEIKQRMQREMGALDSWLQEDLDKTQRGTGAHKATSQDRNDPWSTAHSHDSTEDSHRHDDDSAFGFEDDFDEFVGAPIHVTYGNGKPSTSSSSVPHRAFTNNFNPFAKHSAEIDDDALDFDDEDPDLPSHEEIAEMSKRLFGSASLAPPSTAHTWERLHSPLVSSSSVDLPPGDGGASADSTSGGVDAQRASGSSHLGDNELTVGGADDEDFEFGAFDLSRVLGALQGAKEEIAQMEDEDERRRAAARVALGLVYGLRKDDERGQAEDI